MSFTYFVYYIVSLILFFWFVENFIDKEINIACNMSRKYVSICYLSLALIGVIFIMKKF